MPMLSFYINGDGCWPDLPEKEVIELMGEDAQRLSMAVLDKGMESGRPSVTIRIDLPDGRVVLTETSARLFCIAARAVMGKYPNLFEGD